MDRNWTPESHVTITDACMVIQIELGGGFFPTGIAATFEGGQLCIRGQHKEFGQFECKFEIPADYNPIEAKATSVKGVLRIEVPMRKGFCITKKRAIMIYCNECGKHFDIVVAGKGPENCRCPACGKVHVFDLETFVNKALEQGKKMLRKKRGT